MESEVQRRAAIGSEGSIAVTGRSNSRRSIRRGDHRNRLAKPMPKAPVGPAKMPHLKKIGCQADCRDEDAKAARAGATPLSQHLPSIFAKRRKLESNPAARRNLDPKLDIVSLHASGFIPSLSRIGVRSASMAPRLSDLIKRPDLSTRSMYSAAVICRIPRRCESDAMGHSQENEKPAA